MAKFEPNAILRGAQLTIIGAYRALQNPNLFKHEQYRQAVYAIAAGIIIQLILAIPVLLVRGTLLFSSVFINLERATWDDFIIDTLHFLQHSVLQLPFFLMTLMKYIDPALDNMFMESLDWVDKTYYAKHESEDQSTLRAGYYENLHQYTGYTRPTMKTKSKKDGAKAGLKYFLFRSGRKALIAMSIYLLSFVPVVGKLVLPAFSLYTFNKTVGPQPAIAIFATGLVLPKRYLVIFLQTFYSSRSLMRELLEPYMGRIHFSKDQKRRWFHDREGVLFGFGVGFFLLIKIPYVGVLIYGIAEASTAYLITKITDPPPPPVESEPYLESQTTWTNKKEFLSMHLNMLDSLNITSSDPEPTMAGRATFMPEKKFS